MNKTNTAWPSDVFIVIPSYQAAHSLKLLLRSLLKTVPRENVLVIDDASADQTNYLCAEMKIMCIVHKKNRGKGASLSDGFKELLHKKNARWIITMDADGQHHVDDLPCFTRYAEKNPSTGIIIGKRRRIPGTMPVSRICSNTLTSLALSLLTKRPISDSQCGFRMYSAELLKKVSCEYPRFEMESEIILKACALNFPVGFVGIQTVYFNGGSHISHVRDTLRWIRAVTSVWWTLRKNKRLSVSHSRNKAE